MPHTRKADEDTAARDITLGDGIDADDLYMADLNPTDPLAIELAASRVRSMTLQEIDARLDDRFRLLRGSHRGRVERHQTLRATVKWSYQLLGAALSPQWPVLN